MWNRLREIGSRGNKNGVVTVTLDRVVMAFAGVVLLVARNVRRGRADVAGALRFGGVFFALGVGTWVLAGPHPFPLAFAELQLQAVFGKWGFSPSTSCCSTWPWSRSSSGGGRGR